MITVSKTSQQLTTGLCVQRPTTKAGTKQTMGKSSKMGSRIDLPIQPGEVDEGGDIADHIPEDQWPKVAHLSVGSALKSGPVPVLLPFLAGPGPRLVLEVAKSKKTEPKPEKTGKNRSKLI